MLRSLAGIPRVLSLTWAPLLAWYLAGSLVRASILALAAPIGPQSPLAALLLVPVAVLARLVSYTGMFLVLRRALPGYRAASGGDVAFRSLREAVSDFIRVLLAAIGPFFTLYALIGLLQQDLSDYARASFRYSFLSDNPNPLQVGDGPLVLVVVVVAFSARMLLTVLAPRLPGWVAIPQIYLEATWVFVALTGIGSLFGAAQAWIANRQVVHWWDTARDFLAGLWGPIRVAIDSLGWLTPVAVQVALLPLAWLLIASIVYLRSLQDAPDETFEIPGGIGERLQATALRVPALVRRYRYLVTGAWEEVGRPLVFAVRLILRGGLLHLAVFLAGYGLLFAAGQWFYRGIYSAVGAHDRSFWYIADPVLSLIVQAIVEPLRVVLLAVAFDYCLDRWRERRQSGNPKPSTTVFAPPIVSSTVGRSS